MGVDETIGEAPTDWFAAAPPAVPEKERFAERLPPPPADLPPPRTVRPRPSAASLAPSEAVGDARARAASAATLTELLSAVQGFEGCGLKATAKSLCFARGSEKAREICLACADICQACGDECARHQHDHCRRCAEACRRCADECRRMAAAA